MFILRWKLLRETQHTHIIAITYSIEGDKCGYCNPSVV